MTPAQEAAAFWGCAENVGYSTEQRLQCALKALEFFGGAYGENEVPEPECSCDLGTNPYATRHRDYCDKTVGAKQ